MSESDGGGGNSGNGSRKRSNSTPGGGRTSPSPPRNAFSDKSGTAIDAPVAAIAPAPAPAPGPSSKKKQKKGSRGSSAGVQAFVPPGVVISRSPEDCAPQLTMAHKDQLTVVGNKGFRMARATHGVSNGTWYWECTVLPPETREGHCRLGWSLPTGSLQAPVGYDKSSYAYRDIAGSKVHESLRTDNYGEPWGEGDVIGFLIKLKSPSEEEMIDTVGAASDSGRLSVAAAAAALAAGQSPSERAAKAAEAVAAGGANAFNEIRFFKNGRDQGVAFSGIKPGTYFPAVSLYMGGSVRVNFGPEFVYTPPRSYGWKPVAALKPFTKDEMKSQRNTIKRERAARGLETATRLTGGAPPLSSLNGTGNTGGNGSASSRSASPLPPAPLAPSSKDDSNNNNPDKGNAGRREAEEGSEKGRTSPPPKDDGEGSKRPEENEAATAASGKTGKSGEAVAEASSSVGSSVDKERSGKAGTEEGAERPARASDDGKRESKVTQAEEALPPVAASDEKEASQEAAAAVPESRVTGYPKNASSSATADVEKKGAEEQQKGERTPEAASDRPQNGFGRSTDAKGSSEGGGNGERKEASAEVSKIAVEAASFDGRKSGASGPSLMDAEEEESGSKGDKISPEEERVPPDAEAGGSSGSSAGVSEGNSHEADSPSQKDKDGEGGNQGATAAAAATAAATNADKPAVSSMEVEEGGGEGGSRSDGGLRNAADKDAATGDAPASSS